MADGLEQIGLYFSFGDNYPRSIRKIAVYRSENTLVVRSCDEPDRHLSMILSFLTADEHDLIVQGVGTKIIPERKTA